MKSLGLLSHSVVGLKSVVVGEVLRRNTATAVNRLAISRAKPKASTDVGYIRQKIEFGAPKHGELKESSMLKSLAGIIAVVVAVASMPVVAMAQVQSSSVEISGPVPDYLTIRVAEDIQSESVAYDFYTVVTHMDDVRPGLALEYLKTAIRLDEPVAIQYLASMQSAIKTARARIAEQKRQVCGDPKLLLTPQDVAIATDELNRRSQVIKMKVVQDTESALDPASKILTSVYTSKAFQPGSVQISIDHQKYSIASGKTRDELLNALCGAGFSSAEK